jgi:carbon-monoxide dehydrogenase large subunit
VSLTTGTHSVGQGHATTFLQILADRLGLPNECMRFRQGDTDLIPIGGGSGSSRSTYMGGTAIWRASDEIITKGMPIAADMLEAPESWIRFNDGHFVVSGTNR